MFKQCVTDCFVQSLMDNIDTSSTASSYKLFKSYIIPEIYLSIALPYILKKTLSCFRCSSHSFMIQKGRHLNIDRDYSFCQYYLKRNVYSAETEQHFLIICPLYDDLRQNYFKDSWLNSILCKRAFINIMVDNKHSSIFALARFMKS